MMISPNVLKIFGGIALAMIIFSFGWWGPKIGLDPGILNTVALHDWFLAAGLWGPIIVVGLMMFAILASPVPSAPIALAAGAIYGHYWGTVYVLAGSELGAISAFFIARFFRFEVPGDWFKDHFGERLIRSQNFLMGTVFASRLMPFISFDIVSYAAGLTPLTFLRFATATFAGILPASFLLAHFGSELASDETDRIFIAIVLISGMVTIPVILKLMTRSK